MSISFLPLDDRTRLTYRMYMPTAYIGSKVGCPIRFKQVSGSIHLVDPFLAQLCNSKETSIKTGFFSFLTKQKSRRRILTSARASCWPTSGPTAPCRPRSSTAASRPSSTTMTSSRTSPRGSRTSEWRPKMQVGNPRTA